MKQIFLACTFLIVFQTNAQVQLVLNPQNPVHFSSSDIWDMNIISTQEQSFRVFFQGEIRNQNGTVAHLTSGVVTLNTGVNSFNKLNLPTQRIQYTNQVIGDYESRAGNLPPGDYTYCVAIKCADQACLSGLKSEEKFQVCAQVRIIPPTPLLLALPTDEAKLKEKRPNFSWIPPMPIGADPAISYRMTLVQLRENQAKQDGIQRNRPLWQQSEIHGTSLPFPSELEDLTVGTRYAWRVEAYLGKEFIQTSQVWEFEIIEEKEEVQPMPFVRLKKGDEAVYNAVGVLKFIYKETQFSSQVGFKIMNEEGHAINTGGKVLGARHGENKFSLGLEEFDLEHSKLYQFVVTTSQGDTYSLRFRYYQN